MTKPSRLARILTVLSVLYCAFRPIFAWQNLPAVMASHFGPTGAADGASTKELFFLVYGATTLLVLGSLLGSALLMEKIPVKYLNLPHKEYWAQGRMDEARRRMSNSMWQMSAATMLLLAAILELVIAANLSRGSLNGTVMWLLLGAYFLFTLVWTVKLLTGFTPIDENA